MGPSHIPYCLLHLTSGKTITLTRKSTEPSCFMFLKYKELLDNIFRARSLKVDACTLHSITYIPRIEKEFKDLTLRYYNYLSGIGLINDCLLTEFNDGKAIIAHGINLPVAISGGAIIGLFSLFRYMEEHPYMILSWDVFCNFIRADKALYLSHFMKSVVESSVLRGRDKARPKVVPRPTNHSVIKLGKGIRSNGQEFLDSGLNLALRVRSYEDTHAYGSIQQLFSYYDGAILFPSSYVGRTVLKVDAQITDIANKL